MAALAHPRTTAGRVFEHRFLSYRKTFRASVFSSFLLPVLFLTAMGLGLGTYVDDGGSGSLGGVPYIAFLASGIVCSSAMMSASFEAMYSGFSRMHVQKTWDAIMNAPVTLDDVVLGETVWAASKSFLSGMAVLAVAWALGLTQSALALWVIPVVFLTGLAFAGMGLVMTALSPSYDFFMYYFTLVITPMMLVCGVFFPTSQLPEPLQAVTQVLPLTHAVGLARPLMSDTVPTDIALHLAVLAAYAIAGFYVALVLTRRRLLR